MRTLSLIAVIGVAAAAVAFVVIRRGDAQGTASSPVRTIQAERENLTQSVTAIGTVKSKVGAEVKVGSQLSGVVTKLFVNVGDKVEKGDTLALLDDALWRARVDGLSAELAAAQAEARYAATEQERMSNLRDITGLQREGNKRNAEVRNAAVDQIRARLAEARVQLGYTRITAPVTGTIASVSTYEGETVAASFSAPTFVTIVDLQRLEIQTYVDETDIGKVRSEQKVSVRVDAYPDEELEGRVDAIYPKAQLVNNVVNYIVIVDLVDTRGLLIRPEMTSHINFILDERKGAVSVPRAALLHDGGRKYVVVQSGGGWRKQPVETGIQTGQKVEIATGVAEGETIAADVQQWKDEAGGKIQ